MCILSVYTGTLLKVVGYYDLSVLSMSVMGFQKKKLDGGWGELYLVFFLDFWIFFNFPKPLLTCRYGLINLGIGARRASELCVECRLDVLYEHHTVRPVDPDTLAQRVF